MNYTIRSTGTWQHTLEIEVPAEEVERRLGEVARRIQRQASLPGFRRGRVPIDLVRQHFASSVESEFLESFIPGVTSEAVDQARLNPVVPPLVRGVRFSPGQPLRFEAVVDVRPEIEVKDYRRLPVRRTVRKVDEDRVQKVLAELQEESAVFADLDRAAERGDVVLLDSTRLDAGGRRLQGSRIKSRRVQLGAPGVPADLENGLLGATAGQERTIEIAYPADHPVAELAGQRARYVVKVRKIQAKKLRELDDNFARELFHLESLEELRSRVRLNLEQEERLRSQREVEGAVAEELLRRNPFDLPERLVEWTLDRVIHEASGKREIPEALHRELGGRYRPQVERSLKRELLLSGVARQEKLQVTEEETTAEIDRMAKDDPRQAARIRARYQSAEARANLGESLLERMALEWLVHEAEIQEEVATESPIVVPATR